MSISQEETIGVNRGVALHKMIRLITLALGGEVLIEYNKYEIIFRVI